MTKEGALVRVPSAPARNGSQREIEGRVEQVEDDALRRALRRRAGVIVAQSVMIAAAVTRTA